jgi:hypothetical protein
VCIISVYILGQGIVRLLMAQMSFACLSFEQNCMKLERHIESNELSELDTIKCRNFNDVVKRLCCRGIRVSIFMFKDT